MGPVVGQVSPKQPLQLGSQLGGGGAALQFAEGHSAQVPEGGNGPGTDGQGSRSGRTAAAAGDLTGGGRKPSLFDEVSTAEALGEVGSVAELVEQVELEPATEEGWAPTAIEGVEALDEQRESTRSRLAKGQAARPELEQIAAVSKALKIGAQGGKGLDGASLGNGVEGLSSSELGVQVGKRLEQAHQAALGTSGAFGDSIELALLGRKAGYDLVGFAQGTATQDEQVGPVEATQ